MKALGRALVLMVLAGALSLLMLEVASAANAPGIYDLDFREGYFTGKKSFVDLNSKDTDCPSGGNYVKVLCKGVYPKNDSKEELINLMVGHLKSGNTQRRIGASFIIHTMLGHKSKPGKIEVLPKNGGGSTVAEWKALIRNPDVKMKTKNVRYTVNSAYVKTSSGKFDVVFYEASATEPTLEFTYKGDRVYAIKKVCANPVGGPGFPDIVTPISWGVRAESYAKHNSTDNSSRKQGDKAITSAKTGDSVYWDHDLRNTGPNDMNGNVSVRRQQQTTDLESGKSTDWKDVGSSTSAKGKNNKVFYKSYNNQRKITDDDVGKRICERVRWTPKSSTSSGAGHSAEACVTIPFKYNLSPTIAVPVDSVDEGAASIDGITSSINNDGPTKSKSTKYAVIRFVIRGDDKTVISGGDGVKATGSGWPCEIAKEIGSRTGLGVDMSTCQGKELTRSEDAVIPVPRLGIPLGPNDISDLDLSLGDRLCYTTMVSAYDTGADKDTFRYAQPACIRVAKRPKLQVWGADVRSADKIVTNTTRRKDKIYGSWSEYGVFAQGEVRSSSGAGLSSGPDGRVVAGEIDYNKLTFANSHMPYGKYGAIPETVIPVLVANGSGKTALAVSGTRDVSSLMGGESVSRWTANNLEITGGEISAGKTVIIVATGTVTISGNISYQTKDYDTAGELPQMIIVAQSIVINDNVTSVNSWLISRGGGYISTCGTVGSGAWLSGLSSSVCDVPLQIAGPVVTDQLYLRRTAGANGGNPGEPAEVVNLRPDTYLWAYSQSQKEGSIKTMYTRDLPPRF